MKKQYEIRHCTVCGEPIIKGKNISLKKYEKRRFCSAACSQKGLRAEEKGWYARH